MAVTALLDGDEFPEFRPTLEMIRRNIELEARLIDDLLDVVRIGRGLLRLECRTVDVHDAIRQASRICRGDIDERGIALGVHLAAAEHHVEGDPVRLQQIIWNLLKNASRFTPQAGAITVRTRNGPHPASDGRPRLVIEVADNGAGIEPESLPRIFEPFEQGPVSPPLRSGLGLGLAIGRWLADAHGGRLSASSPGPGLGSTFVLELDTVPGPIAQSRPTLPAGPQSPQPASLRVLLVEDHQDTSEYLARVLRARGHEVTAATRFSEALREAALRPFDLLISDIELPDGSGLDLMRRLHAGGVRGAGHERARISRGRADEPRGRLLRASHQACGPGPADRRGPARLHDGSRKWRVLNRTVRTARTTAKRPPRLIAALKLMNS